VTFGARALIRLGALQHNLKIVHAAAPGAKVMAVIKANAYGHGMLPVAQALGDVDAFAVARLPEAVELYESGVRCPIVVLSGVLTSAELSEAMCRQFEVVVHCREQIELLESVADGALTVWLKFDTGMNRLGFTPDDASSMIARLRACPAVGELRLMSHLASADELGVPVTEDQFARFRSVVEGFNGAVSILNTPGTLGWPQATALQDVLGFSGDHWIRPGLALFGISPFEGRNGSDLGLKPAMQFEARLIAVKPLRQGARVGYRGCYTAPQESTLGIISAGYGDGYSRHFRSGTPVLLNGRQVSLIGNVSMDLIAVDLGNNAADKVGDIATLWGPKLPVEEVAPWADAIPYELVCGVMNREASELID
jgi:alanine racemase